jgi:hypothetical protein
MANAATATFSGRSIITARLKGSGFEPKYIGWGVGTQTGSANSDVNLFNPAPAYEARALGTSSQVLSAFLADTYQVTGSITCATISKTITEAGLFDTATPTAVFNTTLVAAITTISPTTLTLGLLCPTTGNYYCQLGNEVVLVTAGQSTTLVTVVRAQLGSTAFAYASGTPFIPSGDGGAYTGGASIGGATANPPPAGGNMFAHADFAGIAVSVADSINFTFKDQFT